MEGKPRKTEKQRKAEIELVCLQVERLINAQTPQMIEDIRQTALQVGVRGDSPSLWTRLYLDDQRMAQITNLRLPDGDRLFEATPVDFKEKRKLDGWWAIRGDLWASRCPRAWTLLRHWVLNEIWQYRIYGKEPGRPPPPGLKPTPRY